MVVRWATSHAPKFDHPTCKDMFFDSMGPLMSGSQTRLWRFFSNFSCRFQSFPNWLHCFCRRKIQFVAAQNASLTAEECSTTTPPSGVAMLRWMLAKRLRPPWVAPRSEPPGITGHHRAPGFEGWYLSKEGNIRLWKWGITFITTIYPNMVRNLVANLDGCGVAFF